MTFTPCTTWANGIHPLDIPSAPDRVIEQPKPHNYEARANNTLTKPVLEHIKRNPGGTVCLVAASLNRSQSHTRRAIKILEEEGLIVGVTYRKTGVNPTVHYSATQTGMVAKQVTGGVK